MSPPIRSQAQTGRRSEPELPPELLRIIEALAERQARKDYAARFEGGEGQR